MRITISASTLLNPQQQENMATKNLPRLTRNDYTVGWISALAIESAAAAEMLDEEDPILPVVRGDTNNYVLGRIGKHRVVMTCLNEYGGLPAHVVATHLKESFPKVQNVLLVGIGGAIPSKEYPVRLGDVVVSEGRGLSPGVVQKDRGTWEKDGFKLSGILDGPSESLIRATSAMKQAQLENRSLMHTLVKHFSADVLYPEQWKYQGREKDPLRRGVQDLGDFGPCVECTTPSGEYDVPDPRVYYGIISSGNQVIKNPKISEWIYKTIGACCVEMEAHGVMNHFPCLVIRGASDYADEFKNDGWQQYAALTAAAYAKELLLYLS